MSSNKDISAGDLGSVLYTLTEVKFKGISTGGLDYVLKMFKKKAEKLKHLVS